MLDLLDISLSVFVITLLSILVITYSIEQVKIKDTSQLINDVFNALQELPRHFNGTKI